MVIFCVDLGATTFGVNTHTMGIPPDCPRLPVGAYRPTAAVIMAVSFPF